MKSNATSANGKMKLNSLIRRGDLVEVISGKDKGKQGKVTRVVTKDAKVVVEGVNRVTRHVRPSQTNPQSGLVTKELPMALCKVMLVDPKTQKPTRVGIKLENGKKIRVAKKSGAVIPVPALGN